MFSLFLGLNNVSYPFIEIKASHTLRDRVSRGVGGGCLGLEVSSCDPEIPTRGLLLCVHDFAELSERERDRERERWRDETNRSGARRESLERDLEEGEGKWTRESCPGRTKSLIVGSS